MRVPDNARFWRDYLREFDVTRGKPRAEWTGGHSKWVEMFIHDFCVRPRWVGSFGHYRKWMDDGVSLVHAIEGVGFVGVARRTFLASAIPAVEGHQPAA